MYVAFPRSEYYGSSDFSQAILRALSVQTWPRVPLLAWDGDQVGELVRSLLLTHPVSSCMPGSWTPPGLSLPRANGMAQMLASTLSSASPSPGFTNFEARSLHAT